MPNDEPDILPEELGDCGAGIGSPVDGGLPNDEPEPTEPPNGLGPTIVATGVPVLILLSAVTETPETPETAGVWVLPVSPWAKGLAELDKQVL